jgi:hypothetical protein
MYKDSSPLSDAPTQPQVFLLIIFALLLLMPVHAAAQMFSVRSEQQRITVPQSAVYAGVQMVNFAYRGPAEFRGSATDYSFDSPLTHIRLDIQGLNLFATYGRGLGNFENVYSELGGHVRGGVVLIPGETFNLSVPVLLSTDYILIKNNRVTNNVDDFRQNNLGIKSGIQMNARFGKRTRFSTESVAGYMFSITGYGLSSGSVNDWHINNRLYLDRLFGQAGLVIGLDVQSRRYRLEENRFNYRNIYQTFVIGVSF